jgi:hypothetical protein
MQSIKYNLTLMQIMLQDFEAYLLSTVVYWPLSTKGKSEKITPLPRLTLGGLYLTLDELTSQEKVMDRDEEIQYRKIMRALERFNSKWQVGVEQKAQQELNSRISLWHAYLKDLEEDPQHIDEYSHQVRIRVMISHLIDLSGSSHEVTEKLQLLRSIDERIEFFVKTNAFLWDEQLELVYPQEKFPYLYRSPHRILNK